MDKIIGLGLLAVGGYLIMSGQMAEKDEIQPEPVALDFIQRWGKPEFTGTRQPDIFNIFIESPSGNGDLLDTDKSKQTSNFAPSGHQMFKSAVMSELDVIATTQPFSGSKQFTSRISESTDPVKQAYEGVKLV